MLTPASTPGGLDPRRSLIGGSPAAVLGGGSLVGTPAAAGIGPNTASILAPITYAMAGCSCGLPVVRDEACAYEGKAGCVKESHAGHSVGREVHGHVARIRPRAKQRKRAHSSFCRATGVFTRWFKGNGPLLKAPSSGKNYGFMSPLNARAQNPRRHDCDIVAVPWGDTTFRRNDTPTWRYATQCLAVRSKGTCRGIITERGAPRSEIHAVACPLGRKRQGLRDLVLRGVSIGSARSSRPTSTSISAICGEVSCSGADFDCSP